MDFFDYSDEVKNAIQNKKPVLALESTVITHGLPSPINVETAITLEQIARDMHVIPATIAVINGRIKIGLTHQELKLLATNTQLVKASTRDLPYVIAHNGFAGTTVAATAYCAHAAKIKVFATGGIGGVHRGDNLDISADLIELARTPITIVCSGAKAILDLAKTLEFLETYGIPVIGYQAHSFPAFYTRDTEFNLNESANDISSLVKILKIKEQLQVPTSSLVVNPVPLNDEIPNSFIEPIIVNAVRKAAERNITGKQLTPFLLSEVAHETAGKSIATNLALLKNNVKLGAEIALALSYL